MDPVVGRYLTKVLDESDRKRVEWEPIGPGLARVIYDPGFRVTVSGTSGAPFMTSGPAANAGPVYVVTISRPDGSIVANNVISSADAPYARLNGLMGKFEDLSSIETTLDEATAALASVSKSSRPA